MARICIITSGQLGSNPRTVKEATALSAAGHDVTVIATKVLALVEPRDQAVLATADWKTIRVSFARRRERLLDRMLQIVALRLHARTGWSAAATLAHSEMTRRLTTVAKSVPADLYIAHYVAALPAAAAAAQAHDARFAFDAEDFHAGDLPTSERHRAASDIVKVIERNLLPASAYVTAASDGIAAAYATTYGIDRPTVVLNVFPIGNAPPYRQLSAAECAEPSLYWFSQTVGLDRGLQSAIQALALSRTRCSLHIRGAIAPNVAAELLRLARENGVADRVVLLPPEAPDKMETLASVHTLGLAAEVGHTQNNLLALSNKQFSYILAGLPVLMSDTPAHSAFANNAPGATFLFRAGDPRSLADRLDALLGDVEHLREARDCAYRLGQERFNWDVEQRILLQVVRDALAVAA